jgi:hypothetical protein
LSNLARSFGSLFGSGASCSRWPVGGQADGVVLALAEVQTQKYAVLVHAGVFRAVVS